MKRNGSEAEEYVAKHLQIKGFEILERNYTCRGGEIDIIAQHGDLIIFVEVKQRTRSNPLDAITPKKQALLAKAALTYASHHAIEKQQWRFDVATLSDSQTLTSYIENAFDMHVLDAHAR